MPDLFRKTSLEKLSSPEQLDKMIVITPPSLWIALSGAGLIIAAALIWAVFGRLPVNVETQGIYVNYGGTYSVYSEAAGIVKEVAVREGDTIEEGDTIAYLNGEEIQQKLEECDRRIGIVEAVTMDSQADTVNADNNSLIEIKNQMLTVDQTLQQDQAMLELNVEKVAEQRKKVAAAEKALREAETAYYNSLNIGNSTNEQLAYSEAQANLANVSGYLEAAYGNLDQAQVALAKVTGQYNGAKDSYNRLVAEENALAEAIAGKEAEIQAMYANLGNSGTVDFSQIDIYLNTGMDDLIHEYKAAVSNYATRLSENAETKAQLEGYLEEYRLEKEATEASFNNYQADVDKYNAQKNEANRNYDSARANYLNRISGLEQAQNAQTQLSNKYNLALNDYNSQLTELKSLTDSLTQMEVQVESAGQTTEKQIQVIYSQFEATKASIIAQLKAEKKQYQDQLQKCTIVSTVSGTVSDVAVVQGSAINQGSELIKVQQGNGAEKVVVCYVPLGSGKKVTDGMQVLIYPSTVNKQEYGHMEATVESVDTYVASAESLRTQLGNDNLVEAFLKDGPVLAVVCRLREDDGTASGYYWSSSKGKNLEIAEGTLVDASVVIEEKAPITMLIPYMKEKLTIQAGQ